MAENENTEGALTGIEKAAILLLSLTEQDAASIIRHLEPKQVQKVGQAMTSLTDLSQERVAAVHSAFIEEIHFYPGGFPPQYGGYTGGIIDGETRSARRDERLLDLDLNLVQTGVMVRTPIPGTDLRFSGAGRFGYPGYLISLATEDFSLEYWDYQARVDSGTPRNGWTISTFGARDEVLSREMPDEPLKTALRYEFHRVDLKHRLGRGALSARSRESRDGPEPSR